MKTDQEFRGFMTPEEENRQEGTSAKPKWKPHKGNPPDPGVLFAACGLVVCTVLVVCIFIKMDAQTFAYLAAKFLAFWEMPLDQILLAALRLMGSVFAGGVVLQLLRLAWRDRPCKIVAENLAALVGSLCWLLTDAIRILIPSTEPAEKAVRKSVTPGMLDTDAVQRLDAKLEEELAAQDDTKVKE